MELTQKQKVIYICHPYTGNEEFNRQDARKIALKLKMHAELEEAGILFFTGNLRKM